MVDKDLAYQYYEWICDKCINLEMCQRTGCGIKETFKNFMDNYFNDNPGYSKELEKRIKRKDEIIKNLEREIEDIRMEKQIKKNERLDKRISSDQISLFEEMEDIYE